MILWQKSVRCEAFLHTIHGRFAISETAVKNIASQTEKAPFASLCAFVVYSCLVRHGTCWPYFAKKTELSVM
jgi:hypothetical protein